MHLESHKTGRVSHSKFYYVKTDLGHNGRRDLKDQFWPSHNKIINIFLRQCFQLTRYSTLFVPEFHVDNKIMIIKRTIQLLFPEGDRVIGALKIESILRMKGMSNTKVLPQYTITICIWCTCFLSSTMINLFKFAVWHIYHYRICY